MEKLYDTETILKTHGNDKEFVKYIAGLFVEHLPEMAAELKKASVQRDLYHVYFYAHKMKATIDLFSIESLKVLIRKLEAEGKATDYSPSINTDVECVVKTIHECIVQLKEDFAIAG